jgi:2'-5' RNA ligase
MSKDAGRSLRLFFALWPDDDVRARIEQAARDAIQRSGGRAVPVRNLHVTLVFLGQVAAARVRAATDAANKTNGRSFEISFDQIEAWPRSNVLCLTSRQLPPASRDLAEALSRELSSREFALREQLFRPHITLARDAARKRGAEPIAPLLWPISEFALIESNMTKTGSEYSVLERWRLAAAAS